ncbi:DUF4349 domain-containing protein [candidate division WOR-3 bacterium]|nr:DUF4349 domain-containing protein [candidate division WOR-3 bacterium]
MNRSFFAAIVALFVVGFLNAQEGDFLESRGQMIEKSASLVMEVKNIDSAYASIVRLVDDKDGQITSSTISETLTEPAEKISRADLSITLSPENFSEFVTEVVELGVVTEKQITGLDVTEEYYRLRTELYSQLAMKQRLSNLASRSGNVSTVLALEEDLERIDNQISSIQSRLAHLESVTTESSVNLVLTRRTSTTMSGWEKTGRWFFGGMAAVAVLAPLAALGLLITWIAVLIARKRRQNK